MKFKTIKAAKAERDIHPLLQKRFSPYAFAKDKAISDEQLEELFEAASWAASAYNEQPWDYVYAHRGTEGFDQLWSCLAEGNQPWTKDASVILLATARTTFALNGKPNPWAPHDLGMANAQLLLQAAHRDLYGHFMANSDEAKLRELLDLDDNVIPVTMGVLGHLGDPEDLADGYKARDLSPRSRKSVDQFTRKR